MDLSGCCALVTGSSSGIGAATARLLASHKCNVAVTFSSDSAGGEETVNTCKSQGADSALFKLNVADDSSCRNVIQNIITRWGRLDIVINCAGITRPHEHADLEGVSADDFLDLYKINVVGTFQVTRAAAPFLSARPIAHVINVASAAALNGRGSSLAYATSKGALITMTKSLARSLGPTIRVNTICPGVVKGKWAKKTIGEKAYDNKVQLATLRSPLKKMPSDEDIAKAIIGCLTSFDLMTGSSILVDGGAHLGTAHLK